MKYIKQDLIFIEKPINKTQFKDIDGQKFNRLTVLGYAGKFGNSLDKRTYWWCECDCGNITKVLTTNLTKNKSKSCGCFNKEQNSKKLTNELIGVKFGKLTVLEIIRKRSSSNQPYITYNCKCDCGNVKEIRSVHLTKSKTKSCGHLGRGSQTHGTIYGIYNKQDQLVYIGQTVQYKLINRLNKHIKSPTSNGMKEWLNSIDYKPIIKPLIENVLIEYLDLTEKSLIENLGKKYNLLNVINNYA